MKTITLFKTKSLIVCFLFATSFMFAQTTYTVNNNTGVSTDFTDLQAAIDGATNGDILYVQQSATSYGAITINKGLTIVGRSHGDSGYKTEIGTITFDAGSSNTTLKGLKISTIIEAASGSTITDLAFFDNKITTFQLGSTDTFNNVLIQGNQITNALYIYANTSNVLVSNNLFSANTIYFGMTSTVLFSNNIMSYYAGTSISNATTGLLNISNCIFISNYATNAATVTLNPGSGTIQVDNCVTYSYDAAGSYVFSTGAGITINANVQENTDPLFTNVSTTAPSIGSPFNGLLDSANDDLTLQAGSPVSDAGIFQGYNFKNFGTPTGVPSIKVTSYSATVPKNGNLSVTIEAKTN